MTEISKYLDDINNDLESRKHDLPTNPFDKQIQTLRLFPSLREHPECFFTSELYYPENTRDKVDKENIDSLKTLFQEDYEHSKNVSNEHKKIA